MCFYYLSSCKNIMLMFFSHEFESMQSCQEQGKLKWKVIYTFNHYIIYSRKILSFLTVLTLTLSQHGLISCKSVYNVLLYWPYTHGYQSSVLFQQFRIDTH